MPPSINAYVTTNTTQQQKQFIISQNATQRFIMLQEVKPHSFLTELGIWQNIETWTKNFKAHPLHSARGQLTYKQNITIAENIATNLLSEHSENN